MALAVVNGGVLVATLILILLLSRAASRLGVFGISGDIGSKIHFFLRMHCVQIRFSDKA